MKVESYSDYESLFYKIIKEFAVEDLIKNNGFDIEKLISYDESSFSQYRSVVLKSTYKDPGTYTPDNKDTQGFSEQFKVLLKNRGYYGCTKNELKEKKQSERDFYLRKFFLRNVPLKNNADRAYNMYWDNLFDYKYKSLDDKAFENAKIKFQNNKKDPKNYILNRFIGKSSLETNYHGASRFRVQPQAEETGYIVPEYRFLKLQQDYLLLEKTHKRIVGGFELTKSTYLTKAAEIGDYRDLLEKQLQRQLAQLSDINSSIKKSLVQSYKTLEENILEHFGTESHKKDNEKISEDWFFSLVMFKAIYDTFYMNSTDEWHMDFHFNEIRRNPYIEASEKVDLIEFMKLCYKKKKPMISIARKIAIKLRVAEAIIEVIIRDDKLKRLDDVMKDLALEVLPDPEEIAINFIERSENTYSKFGVKDIEPAMRETRDYIIEKTLKNIYRHVKPAAERSAKVSSASLEARKRYVEFYAKAAGLKNERTSKKNKA